MIEFYNLKVSDKKISDTTVKEYVFENGNPVLDENGKQKFVIKNETSTARINTIAHYAIQDTVALLNKKYNLNLKEYALFGGDSQSYIDNFLDIICYNTNFLNNRYENIIDTVFNTEIDYEGQKKYLNLDVDSLASHVWSKKFLSIIEEELHEALDSGTLTLNDLKEADFICLSKKSINRITNYVNKELLAIFNEMNNARKIINRGESFSKNLNLYPLGSTKNTTSNEVVK